MKINHVVLVDDDPAFAAKLQSRLIKSGSGTPWNITYLQSLKELVEYIKSAKPVDLVLLDYDLNESDGDFDYARKLLLHVELELVPPTIVFSAVNSDEINQTVELLKGAYIPKPSDDESYHNIQRQIEIAFSEIQKKRSLEQILSSRKNEVLMALHVEWQHMRRNIDNAIRDYAIEKELNAKQIYSQLYDAMVLKEGILNTLQKKQEKRQVKNLLKELKS